MLINNAVIIPTLQRMAALELPVCNGCTLVRSTWEGSGGCSRGGRGRRSLWPRRTTALQAEGWIGTCEDNKHQFILSCLFSVGAILKISQCAVESFRVDLFPTEPQNCYISKWIGDRPVTAGSQKDTVALNASWKKDAWNICLHEETKFKLFLAQRIYNLGIINSHSFEFSACAIKAQI